MGDSQQQKLINTCDLLFESCPVLDSLEVGLKYDGVQVDICLQCKRQRWSSGGWVKSVFWCHIFIPLTHCPPLGDPGWRVPLAYTGWFSADKHRDENDAEPTGENLAAAIIDIVKVHKRESLLNYMRHGSLDSHTEVPF